MIRNVIKLFLILSLASCGTVSRVSTDKVTDLSGNWNDTDTKLASEYLTKSSLSRNWLKDFTLSHGGKQPIVMVGLFTNDTSEHFDTEILVQRLENEFVNSGSVRLVANKNLRERLRAEKTEQQSGGFSEETIKKAGRELGADFMLFGSIKIIFDQSGNKAAKLYQVDGRLVNIETNEVTWVDNWQGKKVIQKSSAKW